MAIGKKPVKVEKQTSNTKFKLFPESTSLGIRVLFTQAEQEMGYKFIPTVRDANGKGISIVNEKDEYENWTIGEIRSIKNNSKRRRILPKWWKENAK